MDKCIANGFWALCQAVFKDAHQHQEEGVPSLCLVSFDVWRRVLDTYEETLEEDEHFPSQVCTHTAWDHKQKVRGRAHLFREGERAMERRGNHHIKGDEEKVGVVGSHCSNA